MIKSTLDRACKSVREILPKTFKTCLWLIRITTIVTLGVLFLEYYNILPYISKALNPLFNLMGLPGEAALAYVSGFFINVYSAIAIIATLNMDVRSVTILSVMILCSHNMITETAVQKKTGTSALRIIVIRTISAFILGFILNLIMPESSNIIHTETIHIQQTFQEMFLEWLSNTAKLILLMSSLIFALSITQRLLSEFGVIKWLSRIMSPVLAIFGLPAKTSFLWIIANTLGLAYGAAVMIDETESGKITKKDVDLLNHHIAVSHSNFEDVLLLASVGASIWWMLLARWALAMVLVWELRLEMAIRKKILTFAG